MSLQTAIRCCQMRGGSSKGLFFLAGDLPSDPATRDRVLVAAVGADSRQIDGLGGADPLTSKVAIVSRSTRDDADLDYLFAQVVVGEGRVDATPNCGNMLAAVAPFGIEMGLIAPSVGASTAVRVHMVNSGDLCETIVTTKGGEVVYDGDAAIDGAPGTAAPILCNYLNVAGSVCGSLLPTGNARDTIAGLQVTCIDNGMPVVILRAGDLGLTGYESPDELNNNAQLKKRLEELRLACGLAMNLGDVKERVVPKMCIVAPPRGEGQISTRTFIPHRCHAAIGVLGAVSAATACILPDAVTEGIARPTQGARRTLSVEHPSGEFTVQLELSEGDGGLPVVTSAGVIRTARLLMKGELYVPRSVWDGSSGQQERTPTDVDSGWNLSRTEALP